MTQRPCQPTGPISCPPRCGGSSPTTATRGVSGAVAGAPSPLSCSSRGSPTPHLLAPCGSISALFLVPRRDHLQPPLPPRDRPAPPSCPVHPPQPAEAQPCPSQPASTGPLTPGPTAPVLTVSLGSVPATSLPAWAWSLPSSLPLVPDPGPRGGHSASSVGIQGFQAGPVHGASIPGWPGAWADPLTDSPALLSVSLALPPLAQQAQRECGRGGEHQLAGQLSLREVVREQLHRS